MYVGFARHDFVGCRDLLVARLAGAEIRDLLVSDLRIHDPVHVEHLQIGKESRPADVAQRHARAGTYTVMQPAHGADLHVDRPVPDLNLQDSRARPPACRARIGDRGRPTRRPRGLSGRAISSAGQPRASQAVDARCDQQTEHRRERHRGSDGRSRNHRRRRPRRRYGRRHRAGASESTASAPAQTPSPPGQGAHQRSRR